MRTPETRAAAGPPAPPLPDAAILVGGIPRSGTSLMRDILGSHPDVAMFPAELPFWRVLAADFAGQDPGRRDVQQRVVDAIVSHPRMRQAGIGLDVEAVLRALAAEPPGTLGAVFAQAMREYARQAGRPRWGVKDPLSEFYAEIIFADLPAAAMVHMIRDPRDVVASQRAMWGAEAPHVVSTTDRWRRSAALARRRTRGRAARYVAVRYEELVADPPGVVCRVCDVVGLAYRPEMLELSARPSWWAGTSDPPLADRRDIFTESVARHLRQLGAADARFVELRAGREMERWGYRRRPVPLTPSDRGRLAARLAQEAVWRVLRRLGLWLARAGR